MRGLHQLSGLSYAVLGLTDYVAEQPLQLWQDDIDVTTRRALVADFKWEATHLKYCLALMLWLVEEERDNFAT